MVAIFYELFDYIFIENMKIAVVFALNQEARFVFITDQINTGVTNSPTFLDFPSKCLKNLSDILFIAISCFYLLLCGRFSHIF